VPLSVTLLASVAEYDVYGGRAVDGIGLYTLAAAI
jgi:hypothetical protein